jgi:hypothetical protein
MGSLLLSRYIHIQQTTFATPLRFLSHPLEVRHVLAPRNFNRAVRKCFQRQCECSTGRRNGCIEPNSSLRSKIFPHAVYASS